MFFVWYIYNYTVQYYTNVQLYKHTIIQTLRAANFKSLIMNSIHLRSEHQARKLYLDFWSHVWPLRSLSRLIYSHNRHKSFWQRHMKSQNRFDARQWNGTFIFMLAPPCKETSMISTRHKHVNNTRTKTEKEIIYNTVDKKERKREMYS